MRKICVVGLLMLMPELGIGLGLLRTPQGVVYDSVGERYLVANYGAHSIIEVSGQTGVQRVFRSGIRYPMGVAIRGNVLYVSTNLPMTVIGVDLSTKETISRVAIDEPDGVNGVAADTTGYVYAVGQSGWIYRIDPSAQTYSEFAAITYIGSPQAIAFDARFNRLLVAGYGTSSAILAVDVITGTASTIAYTAQGMFVAMALDSCRNLYLSSWNTNQVHVYDSTFTDPPDVFYSYSTRPTGVCYNSADDVVAICDFDEHSMSLAGRCVDLHADTRWGWVPLSVAFEGTASCEAVQWFWDVGTGDSVSEQSFTHVYTEPGLYDVSLAVIDSNSSLHRITEPAYVAVLADSLVCRDADAFMYNGITIPVRLVNNMPLYKITLPVEYGGQAQLYYSGMSREGCRASDYTSTSLINTDLSNCRFTIIIESDTGEPIMPGSGVLLWLQFTIVGGSVGDSTLVTTDGYGAYAPTFDGHLAVYEPLTIPATVRIKQCCQASRGNVDMDVDDRVDMSDLTRLIQYLFIDFVPPECREEANINGDVDERIDISDLTALIDHLFISFAPPADCP